MKPAPFDYVRAESVDEALDVLAQTGSDARVLAGGQSLLPMLNMRLARPAVVIDVMRVGALQKVDDRGGALAVYAGVRQVDIERRPNLTTAGGLAEIEEVLRVREPLYREVAEFAVDFPDGRHTQRPEHGKNVEFGSGWKCHWRPVAAERSHLSPRYYEKKRNATKNSVAIEPLVKKDALRLAMAYHLVPMIRTDSATEGR